MDSCCLLRPNCCVVSSYGDVLNHDKNACFSLYFVGAAAFSLGFDSNTLSQLHLVNKCINDIMTRRYSKYIKTICEWLSGDLRCL